MGDAIDIVIGVASVVAAPYTGGQSLVWGGAALAGKSAAYDQPRAAKKAASASEAARAEQQKVQRAQQRLSEAQNIRGRLAQVREARQQRAANLVRAVNLGGAEGTQIGSFSPAAGAISSVGAQLGSNVGFINASEATGQDIFRANTNISNLRVQESQALQDLNMAKTIGGLGSTIFSMGGDFDTIFSRTPEVGSGNITSSNASYEDLSGAVSFYSGR